MFLKEVFDRFNSQPVDRIVQIYDLVDLFLILCHLLNSVDISR